MSLFDWLGLLVKTPNHTLYTIPQGGIKEMPGSMSKNDASHHVYVEHERSGSPLVN
jgi:hypothetical protein